MADVPDFDLDDEQTRQLKDYCSRLAGDRLCRCGGNMNGRYCLWSYLPPAPAPSQPAAKDKWPRK